MDCFFWNCRGAKKAACRQAIRLYHKKFKPCVIALFETHTSGSSAPHVCENLGFDKSHIVEANGHSGGIWFFWKSDQISLEIIQDDNQFVHAKALNGVRSFNLFAVYACPTAQRRRSLWPTLQNIISGLPDPTFIGGDFNCITQSSERTGGSGTLSLDSLDFLSWSNNLHLVDLGFSGHPFTWSRGNSIDSRVEKRLDRFFSCTVGRMLWPDARVTHLETISSDHRPILLQLTPHEHFDASRRPFRFLASWCLHEEFEGFIRDHWNDSYPAAYALSDLTAKLKTWNEQVFGRINLRKDSLLRRLKGISRALSRRPSNFLIQLQQELHLELEKTLQEEELLWLAING
ncbi:hypothetical protein V2J09_019398 [Rumex salicifolius]